MNRPTGPHDGDRQPVEDAGPRSMSRFLVPVAGFGVLLVLSFTLIGAIMLRPWAGPDNSWRTHMNLTDEPYSGYTRSVQAFVSPEGSAPILTWRPAGASGTTQGPSEARLIAWMSIGCANCHGLKGEGGVVGLNLLASAPDKITKNPRLGPKQMPAQSPLDLTDEDIALIAEYLQEMAVANPQAVPTPTPTPTPRPTPTATPSANATATATAVPTPTSSGGSLDSELLAQGKLIYDKTAGASGEGCAYCHGLDGKGGGLGASNAPYIRGVDRVKIRQAIKSVLDMTDIKLSEEELTAVTEYLKYLNEQP